VATILVEQSGNLQLRDLPYGGAITTLEDLHS